MRTETSQFAGPEWRHRCANCAPRSDDERDRLRQLQLLALLEHPDALPAEDALRLAGELLARTHQKPTLRCDIVEETRS